MFLQIILGLSLCSLSLSTNGGNRAGCPCQDQIDGLEEQDDVFQGRLDKLQEKQETITAEVGDLAINKVNQSCKWDEDLKLQYRKILQMEEGITNKSEEDAKTVSRLETCCLVNRNGTTVLQDNIKDIRDRLYKLEKDSTDDIKKQASLKDAKISQLETSLEAMKSSLTAEKAVIQELNVKLSQQKQSMMTMDVTLQTLRSKVNELSKFRPTFVDVIVEGMGYDDLQKTTYRPVIKKNGQALSHIHNRRGYTFVVLNGKTGQETHVRQYDIYGNPSLDDEAYRFYESIPDNSIVLVSTYDEPQGNAKKVLVVLEKLGLDGVSFGVRDGFAMIGYKGARPSWVVWKRVPRGGGLARVEARVPLMA